MFKSVSTSVILRGILAIAVGIMALAWPGITVLALVILFAVYAFIASGLEAVRAFSSDKARAFPPTFVRMFSRMDLGHGSGTPWHSKFIDSGLSSGPISILPDTAV